MSPGLLANTVAWEVSMQTKCSFIAGCWLRQLNVHIACDANNVHASDWDTALWGKLGICDSHLFSSVWAAIAKYHRLGGLYTFSKEKFISHCSVLWEAQDQDPSNVWWEPTSWFIDTIFSLQAHLAKGWGNSLGCLSYLSLLEGFPSPNHEVGDQISTYEFWRDTKTRFIVGNIKERQRTWEQDGFNGSSRKK